MMISYALSVWQQKRRFSAFNTIIGIDSNIGRAYDHASSGNLEEAWEIYEATRKMYENNQEVLQEFKQDKIVKQELDLLEADLSGKPEGLA